MKIVTYNIQFGRGRDEKVDLDRIVNSIQGADVIALQEVDRYWSRSGNIDEVSVITDRLPNFDFAYSAGVDQAIPGKIGADGRLKRQQFGNLLLSRNPIHYVRQHLLPKYASTGPLSIQRSALECVIETEYGLVRFYSLHLTHLTSETRMPQVKELLRIHREAGIEGPPVCGDIEMSGYWSEGMAKTSAPGAAVLLGDFNFQPDSNEYTEMIGPLTPCDGRVTHPLGFVDAWVHAGGDEGGGKTASVGSTPARLDYAFVSASLCDQIRSCWIDVDADGSDHQPLWLELN